MPANCMSRSERFAEFLVCAVITAWLEFLAIRFIVAFIMLAKSQSPIIIGP